MEKSPTYSPTYSLTYSLTYPIRYSSGSATRDYTSTTLSLSLSLEISSWHMRAHLWRKECGEGASPRWTDSYNIYRKVD